MVPTALSCIRDSGTTHLKTLKIRAHRNSAPLNLAQYNISFDSLIYEGTRTEHLLSLPQGRRLVQLRHYPAYKTFDLGYLEKELQSVDWGSRTLRRGES